MTALEVVGILTIIAIVILAWPCGECLADFLKSIRKGRP